MSAPVLPLLRGAGRRAGRRALVAAAAAGLALASLAGCGHASAPAGPRGVPPASLARDGNQMGMEGMDGMDMSGMDASGTGDDMPGLAEPSAPKIAAADPADDGLHPSVGGYSYVPGATTLTPGGTVPYTFHITGPSGKTLTRFQPYEGQLLVFYLVRADLGDFRLLTASMHDDGTWSVPMPTLAAGSYRTYVTFAAPDSGAGTPLTYSLSQPLTVPGSPAPVALPAPSDTAAVDGYTLSLSGTPKKGTSADLGVTVAKDGKPVQQFDRLLDGYAHLTAVHSGDEAFARALSTGRSAGGPGGGGALTAKILLPESGTWRLFVEFSISGVRHTAAFTVDVP